MFLFLSRSVQHVVAHVAALRFSYVVAVKFVLGTNFDCRSEFAFPSSMWHSTFMGLSCLRL
jgi:hypothetical protein